MDWLHKLASRQAIVALKLFCILLVLIGLASLYNVHLCTFISMRRMPLPIQAYNAVVAAPNGSQFAQQCSPCSGHFLPARGCWAKLDQLCSNAFCQAGRSFCNETAVGTDIHYDTSPMRRPARVVLDYVAHPVPPHISAVIVYHNAGDIVSKTLPTVLANLCGLYEVILVLDGCTDTTLSEIDQVIQDHIQGTSFLATRVRVVEQPTPVWETSAENIGFRLARGTKGIVSIQADMVLAESCFNYAMYSPIRRFADVFSVSGRCAHNFDGSGKVGRCGVDFGQALDADSLNLQPVLFVRNSCNRGPLMFRADALRSLGFLDEHRFFQGNDDHDINARAKKSLNMVAGYIPLGVHGPISWGATRRSPSHENRDGEGADYMKLRLQRSVSSIFHGPPLQDVLSMPSVKGNRSLLHDVAVITGASDNHFKVLYNFVVRMKTHGVFRGSPVPLFVIDFGLTPEQHWLISQRDEVHTLMVFNFSHYPSWMNISNDRAGDYAWKAIGMSMVFPKHASRVLWLDSGDLVHDIGKALNVLWKRNFLSTLTSDTVRRWVHPGMLQYFKQENNTWLLDAPTANGAIIGFTRKTLHLFEVFVQCSLVRECVSPSGSSRSNHRQDQSIITLLSHLHGYSDLVSKPPEEYGISVHHPSQWDIDPGGPSW